MMLLNTMSCLLGSLLLMVLQPFAAHAQPRSLKPTQEGLAYGKAGDQTLTMDYYAGAGVGMHPIAIIIHGGGWTSGTSKNGSEAYCADFLAPAGYDVFSINYRLAPQYPYPAAVHDVERAIRYIRFHAREWNGDGRKIALVGGSAGGYLSTMVGLINASGVKGSDDTVDRESARVQAVVTLFGVSDLRGMPMYESIHALIDPLIKEKGQEAALAQASPITYVNPDAPPFLLIHGDKDESVPFAQSTELQQALQKVGVPCDLIRIPNGIHATGTWHTIPNVPDWERQMAEWLNKTLHHDGSIGAGIRPRQPKQG
jgi:acetyl esterase